MSLAGCAFALSAAVAARLLLKRRSLPPQNAFPAITLLKPLHGAECGLETALASFLKQDYPGPIQIVFGLRYTGDPAIGVVESLKRRFPNRDIAVVVNPAMHGTNRKISNVVNMMKAAKHDYLVLTDSDITVPRDYLSTIAAEAARPGVGIVSCLYTGKGAGNSWSRLSAMGLSYHFLPNATLGIALGERCVSGPPSRCRGRPKMIGGFEAFTGHFVDDYEIGRAAREAGFTIAYPAMTGAHTVLQREFRWPDQTGTALGAGCPRGQSGGTSGEFRDASARIGAARRRLAGLFAHGEPHRAGGSCGSPPREIAHRFAGWNANGIAVVAAMRDLLSFAIFLGSMVGNAVEWRGERLRVEKSGLMSQIQG